MGKAIMLAALAAAVPAPALAKAPINQWLCKVLKTPFDPAAAIAAFPLEALPAAVEKREERTSDDGDKTTSVELAAEGEGWTVEYGYQYASDDVSDPYGFDLRVSAVYPGSQAFEKETVKLLREFGKPRQSVLGEAVFAGPAMFEGGDKVFSFGRWSRVGVYTASWWKRGDVRFAAELCK